MLLYWRGSSFELVYRRTGVRCFVQPMSGRGTSLFSVSHVILVVLVMSAEQGMQTVGWERALSAGAPAREQAYVK